MTQVVKIKGVALVLGGKEYIVPPIALGALEQLQGKIQSFDGSFSAGQVSAAIDCAHAALKRNYPEMTREEVADLIDTSNMLQVFEAVMNVSGMQRAQGNGAGEAAAAA